MHDAETHRVGVRLGEAEDARADKRQEKCVQ